MTDTILVQETPDETDETTDAADDLPACPADDSGRQRLSAPSALMAGRAFIPAMAVVTAVLAVATTWAVGLGATSAALAVGATVTLVAAVATALQHRSLGLDAVPTAGSIPHALADPLTGLPNRVGLLRHLELALKRSRRDDTSVGVLFLDLDRFKVINDSMGHDAGDELLCAVAERLRSTVRTSDVVARFGGDEFVVVCDGLMHEESSTDVARQILAAFEQPLDLLGSDLVVSTSIGIATFSRASRQRGRELLRDADAAMYRAKRNRSGFAVFDDQQRQHVLKRLDTERALRTAMESNELEVYYQPIVSSVDRNAVSVEALVRWNRPDFGVVGPDEFLAVAEETGLMGPLGEQVLREACAQAAMWNYNHPDRPRLGVGVNLAERQLIDATFPASVAKTLSWAGIPPQQLTLEITEDVMIDRLDDSLAVLRSLKDIGVRLAIDDFGTGRSSLEYIKKLDMVDYLKIDKSFVSDVPHDPVDLAIVEAIARLAHATGLLVVAEGVENEEHYETLRALGVAGLQGYLFSKPVRAHEVDAFFGFSFPAGDTAAAAPTSLTQPASAPAWPSVDAGAAPAWEPRPGETAGVTVGPGTSETPGRDPSGLGGGAAPSATPQSEMPSEELGADVLAPASSSSADDWAAGVGASRQDVSDAEMPAAADRAAGDTTTADLPEAPGWDSPWPTTEASPETAPLPDPAGSRGAPPWAPADVPEPEAAVSGSALPVRRASSAAATLEDDTNTLSDGPTIDGEALDDDTEPADVPLFAPRPHERG